MLTHWISMPFDRLSSFWKSSLFITLPPELVLQPFVFQFSTQLVIPMQREYYHKMCNERTTVSLVFQHIPYKVSGKNIIKNKNIWSSGLYFLIITWNTNSVFLNRYLKITALYTHSTHNYDVNFNKLKLKICLIVQ